MIELSYLKRIAVNLGIFQAGKHLMRKMQILCTYCKMYANANLQFNLSHIWIFGLNLHNM